MERRFEIDNILGDIETLVGEAEKKIQRGEESLVRIGREKVRKEVEIREGH